MFINQSKKALSAYVLCGGKSQRMGYDKGLIKVGGITFVELIIKAITPLTSEITLITDNPSYEPLGYRLLGDIVKNQGPAGGIYTALSDSRTEANLIVSCDMPALTSDLLRHLFLIYQKSNYQAVIASDGHHDIPVLGVYSASLKPLLKGHITNGHLVLRNILFQTNFQRIDFGAIPDLFNVNTPMDLETFKQRVSPQT